MLSDDELKSLAHKDWENCPCLQCRARREIVWLRGEIEELRHDQYKVIKIRAILREKP